MQAYVQEIEGNYTSFSRNWRDVNRRVRGLLAHKNAQYLASYKSIVSLQAWRACLLEAEVSRGSLEFFLEAQNDALVSHILARQGIWRSALQSLRSMVENISFCVYYMDHPVELHLWADSRHRLSFPSIVKYLEDHPKLHGLPDGLVGVGRLNTEWQILSRAVHGSARSFRMTSSGRIPSLFSAAQARVGSWRTRESSCVYGVNLLLMCMFREKLQGARLRNLRQAISLVVESEIHAAVQEKLGIRLYKIEDE